MKSGEAALQRQKEAAEKNATVADHMKRLADRRMEVESARGKLFAVSRIKDSLVGK
jgi:hypothetical protein